MRHHAKDVGVAVLAEEFACAIIVLFGIAICNAGHVPPWVSNRLIRFQSLDLPNEYRPRDATATRPSQITAVLLFDLGTVDIRPRGQTGEYLSWGVPSNNLTVFARPRATMSHAQV